MVKRIGFAIDNYINDALVTGYYHDTKSLQAAYEKYNKTLASSVFCSSLSSCYR